MRRKDQVMRRFVCDHKCAVCRSPLQLDQKKKALVCKTTGCSKKNKTGTKTHIRK